jgi:hypothetical protein
LLAEFPDLPNLASGDLELCSARLLVGCATVLHARFWVRVAAGEQEFSELLT